MIRKPDAYHKYHSAHDRFFKPAIEEFFRREFPNFFGPNIISKIADELVDIFNRNSPDIKTLKPGQILWRAVHKNTRADSPNKKLVSVVLTIVAPDDIKTLEKVGLRKEYKQTVIARIMKEAYEQDALLSTRDIGLMLATHDSCISRKRKKFEQENNVILPHTGSLHDMGSCITHKYQIVYKYVIEKKDPLTIAKETNHSPRAVDHYLKDFNRVKILYLENKTPEFIKLASGIPLHVVKQYLDIINQYVKERNVS